MAQAMSNIGRTLHNNGNYVNNINYKTWRVEAEGWDWIVIRGIDHSDRIELVTFDKPAQRQELIDSWAKEPTE